MLDIRLHARSTRGLLLHRMQLTIGQKHGLSGVLVVMREGVVALGVVEAEDAQGHGADHVLLEGELLLLGVLEDTFLSKQLVL